MYDTDYQNQFFSLTAKGTANNYDFDIYCFNVTNYILTTDKCISPVLKFSY